MGQRILCYGDSNTYGYDPRSYLGGRYPKDVRWTGKLEAAGWEIINQGENGRSIPRLDWEFEAVARAARRTEADALTVMLGSNDLLQRPGLTAEVCGQRMECFLSTLLAEVPAELKVLLIAPPPMEPGAWVPDPALIRESRRLADCYETLAKRLGVFSADAGKGDVELGFDGVHFSEAGHQAFGARLSEKLIELHQKNLQSKGISKNIQIVRGFHKPAGIG